MRAGSEEFVAIKRADIDRWAIGNTNKYILELDKH
jgi:hypothetical protein